MLGFFKIITQKLLKVNLNTHKKKTLEKFQRSHLYYSKKLRKELQIEDNPYYYSSSIPFSRRLARHSS